MQIYLQMSPDTDVNKWGNIVEIAHHSHRVHMCSTYHGINNEYHDRTWHHQTKLAATGYMLHRQLHKKTKNQLKTSDPVT